MAERRKSRKPSEIDTLRKIGVFAGTLGHMTASIGLTALDVATPEGVRISIRRGPDPLVVGNAAQVAQSTASSQIGEPVLGAPARSGDILDEPDDPTPRDGEGPTLADAQDGNS